MDVKKILAVATAVVGTVAMADIVSSSVVGYQSAELQENGLTVGACFVPVSGTTIDLTELKVTGYEAEAGTEADVQVQTLDEYGRTVKNYAFYDVPGEFTGWFDDDEVQAEVGDVVIQPGEGLWSMSTGDGFGIQSAGMVPTSSISVILQENGLSIVNPTPVSILLSECSVGGYEAEVGTEADVQAQTLDEYGRTVKNYAFYDVPGDFIGWFDDDEVEAIDENDVTILPGQGLWTMSTADGFTFVFPGVTL